jgi:type IV secretory pathway TrbD component
MSAVFEIELLLKEQLMISEVLNFIAKEGHDYEINLIQIQDDWEFCNLERLHVRSIETCDNLVKQGKIVLINGILKSLYRFGVHLWKPDQTIFAVNFWISTKGIEMLDSNYITENNSKIYSFITNKITDVLNSDTLLLCAIGSELIVSYNNEIEDIINKSKNVCEWIFADEKHFSYFNKFSKSQINGFTIYCLKA